MTDATFFTTKWGSIQRHCVLEVAHIHASEKYVHC